MPGKVTLEVIDGPIKGKVFTFEAHDAFIFGRDKNCHARLPDDDLEASRHHFILEFNPPDVSLRDLGSLNGTYVNNKKYGGRKEKENPQATDHSRLPAVDIKHGDLIQVGRTLIRISVEIAVFCNQCGIQIPNTLKSAASPPDDIYTCSECLKNQSKADINSGIGAVHCQNCGNDVTEEVSRGRTGSYLCASCRRRADGNPEEVPAMMSATFPKDPVSGTTEIHGCELGDLLGQGAMAMVFKGRRKRDDRDVAIKVLLSRIAVDKKSRRQFEREIGTTMRLKHKNVVEMYDSGSSGPWFYCIMEYCPGGSVAQLMFKQGGSLSLEAARPIMLQSLGGLSYIHQQGFVHRDLKPENILLTQEKGGTAKIADMGLAKSFDQAGLSGMTLTGAFAGTPPYLPKEQLVDFKYVKPASDVWSIAATFYRMLTGMYPRQGEVGQVPIEVVLSGKTIPIRDRAPNIQPNLAEVIDTGLAANPDDRYQSAVEFLEKLREVL
jgi:DNA-directed RNA polymerase subunit RPC12/RpoP